MVCLSGKPVVDGLENEFAGRAHVLRVDLLSDTGRELAGRYGVDFVPAFVIFDTSGRRTQVVGGIAPGKIRTALTQAGAR